MLQPAWRSPTPEIPREIPRASLLSRKTQRLFRPPSTNPLPPGGVLRGPFSSGEKTTGCTWRTVAPHLWGPAQFGVWDVAVITVYLPPQTKTAENIHPRGFLSWRQGTPPTPTSFTTISTSDRNQPEGDTSVQLRTYFHFISLQLLRV